MTDPLLRGGRPWGHGGPADILMRDGVIDRIEPGLDVLDAETFDIAGRLVLPGLVDAHGHLDKTLYGGAWTPHSAQDNLADRIANERRRRGELSLPDVDFMTALLGRMVTAGTAHLRTHTDVDPEIGLRRVEAVREAAKRMDRRITVTQVAFPQNGLLTNPGTAELLEQALSDGVAAVGGIDPTGIDGDPVRHRGGVPQARCVGVCHVGAQDPASPPAWASTSTERPGVDRLPARAGWRDARVRLPHLRDRRPDPAVRPVRRRT